MNLIRKVRSRITGCLNILAMQMIPREWVFYKKVYLQSLLQIDSRNLDLSKDRISQETDQILKNKNLMATIKWTCL